MKHFCQDIFRKQDILEGPFVIENFLTSQGDTKPLLELNRRKLNNEQRDSLEGQITLDELTRSLFEDMKGSQHPELMDLLQILLEKSIELMKEFRGLT